MNAQELEVWKMKKTIKYLDQVKGNGTSMITLIIPTGSSIPQANKLLTTEYGTASNIKSRVNKLSVLSAITSAQQKLKLYSKTPENGLVVFCGEGGIDGEKEKKISVAFEPFKPISTSLYLCDTHFHTDSLKSLLQDDKTYGYIVIDGEGCLFGTVSGVERRVLHSFEVELPKKHNKGGQSSVRFGRLRMESRHNYVMKCSEIANNLFIDTSTCLPNVSGLVLAGLADFKSDLIKEEIVDKRLRSIVIGLYDTAYGGQNGFNQAIELSSTAIQNSKLLAEKKVLNRFMETVLLGGNVAYSEKDVLYAMEAGAVSTLIIYEDYVSKDTEKDVLEFVVENHSNFGCGLVLVSDQTHEGSQFVKGFGGIGALLRYEFVFEKEEEEENSCEFVY